MKWLHISDVHCSAGMGATQASALREMVAYLARIHLDRVDFVFITGDVAYNGLDTEYEAFEETLLEQLRSHFGAPGPSFVIVPGNHDVDHEAGAPVFWDRLGEKKTKFFDESEQGIAARRNRARAYDAYEAFLGRAQGCFGVEPSKNVSLVLDMPGTDCRIVTTNTSWFATKKDVQNDNRVAPSPLQSLRQVAGGGTNGLQIILGHHPLNWFTDEDKFKTFLRDNNSLYIHGHTHRVLAMCLHDRLAALGFGATYQDGPDASAEPGYSNSFAVCELVDGNLHVQMHCWTAHGDWDLLNDLPAEFHEASSVLPGGYVFRVGDPGNRRSRVPQAPDRRAPLPGSVIVMDTDDEALIALFRLAAFGNRADGNGTVIADAHGGRRIEIEGGGQIDAIFCLAAPGHVLSEAEIYKANTDFDMKGYNSLAIVTLGQVSAEAAELCAKLQLRKQIRLLAGSELAVTVLRGGGDGISHSLYKLDAGMVTVDLLYRKGLLHLVVRDRTRDEWFYALDSDGREIPESADVVRALRSERSDFERLAYRSASQPGAAQSNIPRFDRESYLASCSREFNSVRYAALAALGLRFQDIPLTSFYIDASADQAMDKRTHAQLARAIHDQFEDIELDESLREQFEAQVMRAAGVVVQGESGQARKLYQAHSSLLVLGDPGSGKTCFVKNEILAYCLREATGSWYAHHLPVYVGMAEAAQYGEDEDIVVLASRVSGKRGVDLPVAEIRTALATGTAAFFFDGIDEVVAVGRRALLVEKVAALMDKYSALGNRFVLTSRPAAVEMLDMPKGLTTVRLSGLVPSEMRALATNILAMRVSAGAKTSLALSKTELSETDRNLVNQIMFDCEHTPGIKRIAQNPLLLTLLVMVYANSGAPSAKRHRIYGQAVQTLASVRSRQAGQNVLADADLRRRLGALALKTFQDPIGSIPTYGSVIETIGATIAAERGTTDEAGAAKTFVQQVAEATGLLVIQAGDPDLESRVTFMHHSFLEYYAAVALLSPGGLEELKRVSNQPRWREVVVLAAGLLADTGDASGIVEHLLGCHEPYHDITLDSLVLAMECALEGEVPSERIVVSVLAAVEKALTCGPAQYDGALRARLGDSLSELWMALDGGPVEQAVVSGLRSSSAATRAAFVDLLGHLGKRLEQMPASVIAAFDEVCEAPEILVRLEVLSSMSRAPSLRTEAALRLLRVAFGEAQRMKSMAARVVEHEPGLALKTWTELIRAIGDESEQVAVSAARGALRAGLASSSASAKSRPDFVRALERLETAGLGAKGSGLDGISVESYEVETLLRSPSASDRVLGARLLPWSDGDEGSLRDGIVRMLASSEFPSAIVAALGSLRGSARAARLLRVSDLELIRNLLESPRRDVRIAAALAFGELGHDSSSIAVLERFCLKADPSEIPDALQALLACGAAQQLVADAVFRIIRERFPHIDRAVQPRPDLVATLRGVQLLDTIAPEEVVVQLEACVADFRPKSDLRTEALLAFAKVARPTPKRLNTMAQWLTTRPVVRAGTVERACRYMVRNCSRSLTLVVENVGVLPNLQAAIERRYERIVRAAGDVGTTGVVPNLREAIEEIHRLRAVYGQVAMNGRS